MPKPKLVDRLIKKVELILDGQAWPLVITHNVLIECEELTGLNVLTGEANLIQPSAKLLRGLLYCSLKHAGAPYTLEQVGDLIGPHNIALTRTAIFEAWVASMPPPGPDEERPTEATG